MQVRRCYCRFSFASLQRDLCIIWGIIPFAFLRRDVRVPQEIEGFPTLATAVSTMAGIIVADPSGVSN